MPRMQHRVLLSADDRAALRARIADPATPVRIARRAQALLLTDRNGPCWPDARVATATSLAVRTICRLRLAWTERGRAAVQPRGQSPGRPPLTAEQTARLVALRLGPVPDGRAAWSLRLLASRAVELEIAPALSHETVRRTLKKTSCPLDASVAG